jgi:hypothetical protein
MCTDLLDFAEAIVFETKVLQPLSLLGDDFSLCADGPRNIGQLLQLQIGGA